MKSEEIIHSISSVLFIILVLTGLILILSFCFKPTKLLEKSRDAHRLKDLQDLANTVNLYLADNKNFDTLVTDQSYDTILAGEEISGSGWVPLNIQSISSGAPLGKLPIDPLNNLAYNYRFGVNVANKTYEFDCVLEEGTNQKKMLEDDGNNLARYEVGTDLKILQWRNPNVEWRIRNLDIGHFIRILKFGFRIWPITVSYLWWVYGLYS